MDVPLIELTDLLQRTPRILRSWLEGVPDAWTRATEGPGTWSPFDVVGHLIDGEETDWIPRLRIILEHGAGQPFEPFDRFRHKALNSARSMSELLDRFERLRKDSLEALASRRVTEADYPRAGRHPELGPVTLGQLMATWAAHDLDHLAQIARVMARRLAEDVGPWEAYLRIVRETPLTPA